MSWLILMLMEHLSLQIYISKCKGVFFPLGRLLF